jgi:DNA polymerase-3 subunit delta
MNNLHKILSEINAKSFYPVYALMGEEAFFIDRIERALREHVLQPHERDFNEHILYGKDCDTAQILAVARQFPVMAAYQLVIVREAQHLMRNLNDLLDYIANPVTTTVLVICIKGRKPDGKTKFQKALAKANACFFKSNVLYDNQWPGWVESQVSASGRSMHPIAIRLLLESVGGRDLGLLSNSLDKILDMVPADREIKAEDVEQYIGISREYNYFEFTKAFGERDIRKLMRIVQFYSDPSKKGESPALLGTLINYMGKVLKMHSLMHIRDDARVASQLGLGKSGTYFVKEYRRAAASYDMKELTRLIAWLRKADARAKGVGADHYTQSKVLREFVGELRM